MSRTKVYSALILRSRPSGESNRDVWLLAAEAGLLRATVFGGPKSRLRSHAAPFHSGQVWIYHDPVRDSRKISDLDIRSWRQGIRELYERAVVSDAVAETILDSHGGGGNWGEALALSESVFDVLETADEELCGRVFVYFLWRWTAFLGLQPELEYCVSCGKPAGPGGPFGYSPREGGMICPACADARPAGGMAANGNGLFMAGPGCRRWLGAINSLAASQVARYTMDAKSFREARGLTMLIMTGALGKRPGSWDALQ